MILEREQREWEMIQENLEEGEEPPEGIERMKWPRMTMKGMMDQIEGWEKDKAVGPDGVKGEVIKEIVKEQGCRKALLERYNSLFGGNKST